MFVDFILVEVRRVIKSSSMRRVAAACDGARACILRDSSAINYETFRIPPLMPRKTISHIDNGGGGVGGGDDARRTACV